MSYSECKEAFISRGQKLDSLFAQSWQVSDDESNIRRGADYFLITLPSTFAAVPADAHSKYMTWVILFDFYVRYGTKLESTRKFELARDLIVSHFHADPWLEKTPGVYSVAISAASEVLQDRPNNPNFIVQTMSASIRQRVKLNLARSL